VVQLAEHLDLLAPRLGAQVLADKQLREIGLAEHGRLRGEHELFRDRGRRERPADAHA